MHALESRYQPFEKTTYLPTVSPRQTSNDDNSRTTHPRRSPFAHRQHRPPESCWPPSPIFLHPTKFRRRHLNVPQLRPPSPTNNVIGAMPYPCPVFLELLIARMCNGEMGGDVVSEKRGLEYLQVSTPNLRRPYLANARFSLCATFTASRWDASSPNARVFAPLAPQKTRRV
ncbi:hypothetical protein SCHPADRAFT_416531 [Schizopora paradoxa]|uniref:Uncharacterized protein n=1 Tax=Schizopora paradoxa TaxID=27342 RepID=A0A0H2RKR7_9AGAM|nr:hypothetical protein SCHPADRAFT_416531 [Schizopora paradoxa]